ncbi:MAG: S41 family peptidase [Rhodospirillales bacterium]|nr:S41 family peptidase [Rhodospirillales bacterium]
MTRPAAAIVFGVMLSFLTLAPAMVNAELLGKSRVSQTPATTQELRSAYAQIGRLGRAFERLSQGTPSEILKALDLVGEVFNRIRTKYWRQTQSKLLIDAALAAANRPRIDGKLASAHDLAITAVNGMIHSLDPFSSFTPRRQNKKGGKKGARNFGRIGIELVVKDGVATIIAPYDGSPAANAGLKPGDTIARVDGREFHPPTTLAALEALHGPLGGEVNLTIERAGAKPFTAKMVRAIISRRSVTATVKDGVAFIRISVFAPNTARDLRRAIKRAKPPVHTVVLDLRNNPGGLLDQGIRVADAFLDRGEIVSTRPRRSTKHRRFNARLGDIIKGGPLAVLVNGGSASASEIVAGALQDQKRAIIIGEKSFGKGSVQTIMRLKGHGTLRLTTSLYFTPSGRTIHNIGITPDVTAKACLSQNGASDQASPDAWLSCAANILNLRKR